MAEYDNKLAIQTVIDNQYMITELSKSEIDLLIRIATGKTNAQIAQDLNVREQTIKNRVYVLMKKLRTNSRVCLAIFACLGYTPSEIQLRSRWRHPNRYSEGNVITEYTRRN